MTKYGIQWDDRMSDIDIEMSCYLLKWPKEKGGLGAAGHMLEGLRLLFPAEVYSFHDWTYVRAEAWCECPYDIWWGPASVGKSTDVAAFALWDWLCAPDRTRTVVCSTTMGMLEDRIWSEILRLYFSRTDLPGKYLKNDHKIVYSDSVPNACIVGIAVRQGSKEDAVGNIKGAHKERNRVILDEMPHILAAAEQAAVNLSASGDFKFQGMGNPVSRYDLMGINSEPLDGWSSITVDSESWRTKKGWVHFFNGLKCPSLRYEDGHKRWPYLLWRDRIEETKRIYGERSLEFMSERVGFMPDMGSGMTVISEADLEAGGARKRDVVWRSVYRTLASIDPAFSSYGDRCVIQLADIGFDVGGVFVCCFREPIYVQIENDPRVPRKTQITRRVVSTLRQNGVAITDTAIDVTAAQIMLADDIEEAMGVVGLFRVSYSDRATDTPIPPENKPANQVYGNRVTQLWCTLAQFISKGHIRGLSTEAAKHLTSRLFASLKPMKIETKMDMKDRLGYSPDDGDACAQLAAMMLESLGIIPGVNNMRDPSDVHQVGSEDVDSTPPPDDYSTPMEQAYA